MGLARERRDAGDVRRGHRRARERLACVAGAHGRRNDADARRGDVRLETAVPAARPTRGKAGESGEIGIRKLGSDNGRCCVVCDGSQLGAIGRAARWTLNPEERNRHNESFAGVRVGGNRSLERRKAGRVVHHHHCSRTGILAVDRLRDSRTCAAVHYDDGARRQGVRTAESGDAATEHVDAGKNLDLVGCSPGQRKAVGVDRRDRKAPCGDVCPRESLPRIIRRNRDRAVGG